jgi:hypothetical protein
MASGANSSIIHIAGTTALVLRMLASAKVAPDECCRSGA